MLQVVKVEAERDEAAKKAEVIEAAEAEASEAKRELEAVRTNLLRAKEDVEGRDSELEAKSTEVEVLKVTVEQLKAAYSQINNNGGEKKVRKELESSNLATLWNTYIKNLTLDYATVIPDFLFHFLSL